MRMTRRRSIKRHHHQVPSALKPLWQIRSSDGSLKPVRFKTAIRKDTWQQHSACSMGYFGCADRACAALVQAPLCLAWLILARPGSCASQRCFLLGHRKRQPGRKDAWLLRRHQVAVLLNCNSMIGWHSCSYRSSQSMSGALLI